MLPCATSADAQFVGQFQRRSALTGRSSSHNRDRRAALKPRKNRLRSSSLEEESRRNARPPPGGRTLGQQADDSRHTEQPNRADHAGIWIDEAR